MLLTSLELFINPFPIEKRKKCSLLPVLASHAGMLHFLGFDFFSNWELLYFVNGNTTTENRMP